MDQRCAIIITRPNDKLERQLRKAVLVAPSDTDLEFSKCECEWLMKYAKDAGMDIEIISSYEEIIHALMMVTLIFYTF
jgi:hypothetical protein